MSGIFKGTLATKDGIPYVANVILGQAHCDYARSIDGGAASEVRLNPDVDYHPENAGVRTNVMHLEFSDSFAAFTANAQLYPMPALAVVFIEAIDFEAVSLQNFLFPLDRMIYMSDRPLYSDTYKPSNSIIGEDTGPNGTFIMMANKGISGGSTLYWVNQTFEDVFAEMCDAQFLACV